MGGRVKIQMSAVMFGIQILCGVTHSIAWNRCSVEYAPGRLSPFPNRKEIG